MVGIGIIGAGRICAAHASAANALNSTRLVAIADVDADRVGAATEKWGGKGYTDYQAMLADPEVEAVVVGLPHWLHLEATLASLQAGKHVLLEKPMAMNVAECDQMVAAADAAGKHLMVAHSQHFFPVNIEARRLIQAGDLGNIVLATDTWYKPFHEGVRPPWFMDASKGGGMWPMNGSHMIDRMMFLLDSRVVAVKAKVGNPIWGYSATDLGVAYLEFENGVAATLMHAGYRDGVNRFEAELTGTEGQLRFSGDAGKGGLLRSREGQWTELPVPPLELDLRPGVALRAHVFAAEMQEFAAAIQEGRPPAITADYGREVVRVLEACEESSRTGREVRLD